MAIMVNTNPWRVALLALAQCAGSLPIATSLAGVPHGVFSLSTAGQAANTTVLANPNVTGISIRDGWADLEPTEGVFNWAFLDSEVAKAEAAGKQVSLRILTQSDKPAWVTTAVSNAGGNF